jgi:hypothetical protein
MDLKEGADPDSQILRAATEDVAITQVDVMEHVPVGIIGDGWPAAAGQTAEAGHQVGGLVTRQLEIRPFEAAIAMAKEETPPYWALLRLKHPTSDLEAARGVIVQVQDA